MILPVSVRGQLFALYEYLTLVLFCRGKVAWKSIGPSKLREENFQSEVEVRTGCRLFFFYTMREHDPSTPSISDSVS